MPYQIIRDSLVSMRVDAIVNPTDALYTGTGGMDYAVHRAAGPELDAACAALDRLKPGEVAVTDGFKLPCRYVIHTLAPIQANDAQRTLSACYRNALLAASARGCETVAVPLIPSGCPRHLALRTALEAIRAHLARYELTVYVIVFEKAACAIDPALQADVEDYLDAHYNAPDERPLLRRTRSGKSRLRFSEYAARSAAPQETGFAGYGDALLADAAVPGAHPDLEDLLAALDEGFSGTLLRLIDERGMTDAECYKRANISKQLFSKIRSNPQYQPSKPTVLAFAVALELSLEETKQLLEKAGLALSRSSRFDVIVSYFLSVRNYNLMEINEVLFQYDLPCLGNIIS